MSFLSGFISERVQPAPQLWVARYRPIRFVEIHATRGDNTPELQYRATINWMQSYSNNQGGWGGSCSYVIGRNWGECALVLEDWQMPTYSAGFGGSGTYAIDEYGISIELAQSPAGEPYTDWQYHMSARICAQAHVDHGVPVQFIAVWNQSGPVPAGYVRHDRCQNGVKLGKSDPGGAFQEYRVIAETQALLFGQGDNDMANFTDEERILLLEGARAAKMLDIRIGGDGHGNGLEPFAVRIEEKINRLIDAVAQSSGMTVADVEAAMRRVLLNGVKTTP